MTAGPGRKAYRWSDVPHLAARTIWSLRKPKPDADGERWLFGLLSPAEQVLYRSMCSADRAHATNSAQAVEHLGHEVAVASALHDVGKTHAGLGTPGRVAASFAGLLMHDRAFAWRNRSDLLGQIGRYLDHSDRGATDLADAGSSELAIAWAREHHLAPEAQTLAPDLAAALTTADE